MEACAVRSAILEARHNAMGNDQFGHEYPAVGIARAIVNAGLWLGHPRIPRAIPVLLVARADTHLPTVHRKPAQRLGDERRKSGVGDNRNEPLNNGRTIPMGLLV